MKRAKVLALGVVGVAVLLTGRPAGAAVVWQDALDRVIDPTGLNPYDFTGNGTNDYPSTITGATVSVTGGRAVVTDNSTSQFAQIIVPATQYGGFSSAAGNQVKFSVDLRVNALSGVTPPSASAPRFVITSNNNEVFFGAFSAAGNVDADAGNDLLFYATAGASTVVPSAASAVGLTGTTWQDGFDFGDYDATTAANNDTNGHFYRLTLTFTQGSTAVSGTLTNVDDPSQTTSFTRTLAGAFTFDNSGNSSFKLLTGQGGSSVYEFDNLSVDTVVPEPGVGAMAAVGVGALAMRRRRRSIM